MVDMVGLGPTGAGPSGGRAQRAASAAGDAGKGSRCSASWTSRHPTAVASVAVAAWSTARRQRRRQGATSSAASVSHRIIASGALVSEFLSRIYLWSWKYSPGWQVKIHTLLVYYTCTPNPNHHIGDCLLYRLSSALLPTDWHPVEVWTDQRPLHKLALFGSNGALLTDWHRTDWTASSWQNTFSVNWGHWSCIGWAAPRQTGALWRPAFNDRSNKILSSWHHHIFDFDENLYKWLSGVLKLILTFPDSWAQQFQIYSLGHFREVTLQDNLWRPVAPRPMHRIHHKCISTWSQWVKEHFRNLP